MGDQKSHHPLISHLGNITGIHEERGDKTFNNVCKISQNNKHVPGKQVADNSDQLYLLKPTIQLPFKKKYGTFTFLCFPGEFCLFSTQIRKAHSQNLQQKTYPTKFGTDKKISHRASEKGKFRFLRIFGWTLTWDDGFVPKFHGLKSRWLAVPTYLVGG